MTKRRNLPTRALGAEPGLPGISDLAGWVAKRRGTSGDLTSYLIEAALVPQKDAGITFPCGGGLFYRERLLSAFAGIEDGAITGETDVRPDPLVADACDLVSLSRGAWCAFPAPHLLQLTDRYYGDTDEAGDAVLELYRAATRAMRDAGAGGHVLICGRAEEVELSSLARQKVFFFHPAPERTDLENMLEYQRLVAAGPGSLADLFTLSGEYDLARLILLDPDEASIRLALTHLDPDQITVGGYCTDSCGIYWKDIAGRAFCTP